MTPGTGALELGRDHVSHKEKMRNFFEKKFLLLNIDKNKLSIIITSIELIN